VDRLSLQSYTYCMQVTFSYIHGTTPGRLGGCTSDLEWLILRISPIDLDVEVDPCMYLGVVRYIIQSHLAVS
jgi:hypothetical protein